MYKNKKKLNWTDGQSVDYTASLNASRGIFCALLSKKGILLIIDCYVIYLVISILVNSKDSQ